MKPRVILNMVTSIDGKATVGGKVGDLTGPADQERLLKLRRDTGCVLVGAGTARNEGYSQLLPEGEDQPLCVIVSHSGNVNDIPLLKEPDARVEIVNGDLPAVFERLHEQHGIESIVCEGGPMLNDTLFAAGLVDEFYLTISPKLLDGGERSLSDSTQPHDPIDAKLIGVDHDGDFVFLHYEL